MEQHGPKISLCVLVDGKWVATEHTLPENVRLVPADKVDDARKLGYYTLLEEELADQLLPPEDSRVGH